MDNKEIDKFIENAITFIPGMIVSSIFGAIIALYISKKFETLPLDFYVINVLNPPVIIDLFLTSLVMIFFGIIDILLVLFALVALYFMLESVYTFWKLVRTHKLLPLRKNRTCNEAAIFMIFIFIIIVASANSLSVKFGFVVTSLLMLLSLLSSVLYAIRYYRNKRRI